MCGRQAQTTLAASNGASRARDRIAYQYAHDYCDILTSASKASTARESGRGWSVVYINGVYLHFWAASKTATYLRKYGPHRAQSVSLEARSFIAQFSGAAQSQRIAAALKWDAELKQKRLNPGTSAGSHCRHAFCR